MLGRLYCRATVGTVAETWPTESQYRDNSRWISAVLFVHSTVRVLPHDAMLAPYMVWYGMVNVDLYSAIITKVSNALNTLVSGEKPGFQALSKGLVVLLCADSRRPTVDSRCRGTTISCCVSDLRRCLPTTSVTGVQQSTRHCRALPCRHQCMMTPSLYVTRSATSSQCRSSCKIWVRSRSNFLDDTCGSVHNTLQSVSDRLCGSGKYGIALVNAGGHEYT